MVSTFQASLKQTACTIFFIAFALLQFSCAKKSPTEPDLTDDRGIALTETNEQVLGNPGTETKLPRGHINALKLVTIFPVPYRNTA